MSRESLAKYVFTESPTGVFNPDDPLYDATLKTALDQILGPHSGINHVGSLYARIIELAETVNAARPPGIGDLTSQIAQMQMIKGEGEVGHFHFFRDVFNGTHVGFNGVVNPWGLPKTDANYPALPLPMNPSIFKETISDANAILLGRVANIHYWLILVLLDSFYRFSIPIFLTLAKAHMTGPLINLGNILGRQNQGLPFDVLDVGYAPSTSKAGMITFCLHLLDEADSIVGGNAATFTDFDNSQSQNTRSTLKNLKTWPIMR